jgi:osmotically-inducible protein OsmY
MKKSAAGLLQPGMRINVLLAASVFSLFLISHSRVHAEVGNAQQTLQPDHASDSNLVEPTPSSLESQEKAQEYSVADSSKELTAQDQSESEADREITKRIRQAVMEDSTLSFTAKNIKIITVDGKVTLKGAVKNETERGTLLSVAQQAAGTIVTNQIELQS